MDTCTHTTSNVQVGCTNLLHYARTVPTPVQASSLLQVLPLPSVSNQLTLALSFIRGLRKLGFSLEFIKMECSRVEPASLQLPAQGLGSLPPPHGHHTLPQCWLPLGTKPGGPKEEAGR